MEELRLFFLLTVVSLIFYFFVVPILQFYDWIEWWNRITKLPGENYKCIDMIALAYNQNGSKWVYDMYSMNQTFRGSFTNEVEAEFLMNLLMTQSTLVRPHDGRLGPRELCYSIIPTGRQFSYPETIGDWRELVAKWVGIPKHEFGVLGSEGGMEAYIKAGANPNSWESKYVEENFLYQTWGFTWNSPIVVAFITGWASSDPRGGVPLYKGTLLTQLLSQDFNPELSGGWKGMLQTFLTQSGTRNIADVETYLWSSLGSLPNWYSHNKAAKKNCTIGNWGSAIGGGAGLAGAGAGVGAMVGGPVGAAIGGLIGLGFGIFQAYGQLTSQCNP